ncbi:MAG: hypothetical protein FJ100_09455 [Deltaproteobacteria bacterium]|nr:hypothetical protein [Deltaproteobacteria bacterium]
MFHQHLPSAALGLSLALCACGGSAGYVVETKPAPPPPAPEAPRAPDAFADHRGDKVALGSKFRLAAKPIGVHAAQFVVSLHKVDWSTMTTPSGKEVKEGAAQLTVTKGEEATSALVPQGESKRFFGYRVEVLAAGEDYNKQRLTYEPWVELLVKADE